MTTTGSQSDTEQRVPLVDIRLSELHTDTDTGHIYMATDGIMM